MIVHPHLSRQVVLRKKEDRRIRAGHPWVFSNEIREMNGAAAAGDIVEVLDAGGLTLGIGMYHPHSLIAVRILSRSVVEIDRAFFRERIARAVELRECLYPGAGAVRLIHGESDLLPGLVVDRFNDYLSLQTYSAGMDLRTDMICDVLEEILHPTGIVERNESPLRSLEGLALKKAVLRGTVATTVIREGDLQYHVDVMAGQKTGFYLDQRENRRLARSVSSGLQVLDCFCNDGGFACNAARGGATAVLGLDASAEAIERARENAAMNDVPVCTFEVCDVFNRLATLQQEGRMFDLVILDPPSFTKSRKNVATARKGYRDLHHAALRLLHRGGFLITASCSHHITGETFLDIVDRTCREADRTPQVLEWRGAAPDHPTLPQVPETLYLKCGLFRVL
jgi:23S rRNA (cytosine1962-C5)-methyltransferase